MNRDEREAQREANREKNARRRAAKAKSTSYARDAAKARKGLTGFGKVAPNHFNRLAEGTGAVRRAEVVLDPLKLEPASSN